MKSNGMVMSQGITYRIKERAACVEVVRLLDDRLVGTFRCRPRLEVIESSIGDAALLAVAKETIRGARLHWTPNAEREQRARTPSPSRTELRRLDLWAAICRWTAVASSREQTAAAVTLLP